MSEREHQPSGPSLAVVLGGITTVFLFTLAVITVVAVAAAGDTGPGVERTSTVNIEVGQWHVNAPPTVPAGDVTFRVRNGGTMVHELLVLRTDTPADQLPITDAGDPPVPVSTGANKVSEDESVGETGDPDLEPGNLRTFTIEDLAPGHYVLICNLEGHYTNGMRVDLTVTD